MTGAGQERPFANGGPTDSGSVEIHPEDGTGSGSAKLAPPHHLPPEQRPCRHTFRAASRGKFSTV